MQQIFAALLTSILTFTFPALESQIQALHTAAATATEAVNARGDTVVARLQDIPNRVQEVTSHGVHRGAALALAIVQTLSENDLRTLHPIFPEGEAWEEFEELTDDLSMVATTISEDVSLDVVIDNVFADDSDQE